MTFRDPKNPAPRGGEGSRRDPAGGRPSRTERLVPREPRPPVPEAPNSIRRPGESDRAPRETGTRSRSVPPPPASSRTVPEPRAQQGGGARRPSATDAPSVQARAAREPRPTIDDPNDPAAWSDLADDWAEPSGDWEELPVAEPRRPAPSRRRTRERPQARTRPAIDLSAARLPSFAGRADLLGDQVAGILIGANLLSLLVMVVRLTTQLGQLPPSLVMHLDPAGIPDAWGPPSVLWRLPLIAGMSLLMNLIVAWFVSPIDRFAARFVLAAALGVQLIVWIAVLDFV